jgi:outer membrane protein OmpA-like peptidoglycan-associated protein
MKTVLGWLLAGLLVSVGAEGQNRMRQSVEANATGAQIAERMSVVPPADVDEVSVSIPIEFEFGKWTLTQRGMWTVDQIALALNDASQIGNVFLVEGHTDSVGSDESNLRLSKRRAETVKAALVSRGVSEARLTVAGYGELRLLPGLPGTDGRNRRVEIVRRVR